MDKFVSLNNTVKENVFIEQIFTVRGAIREMERAVTYTKKIVYKGMRY